MMIIRHYVNRFFILLIIAKKRFQNIRKLLTWMTTYVKIFQDNGSFLHYLAKYFLSNALTNGGKKHGSESK